MSPEGVDKVILPGYCQGDLAPVTRDGTRSARRVRPRRSARPAAALRPGRGEPAGYGGYDIEILAEINHAPRLELDELLRQAEQFRVGRGRRDRPGLRSGDDLGGVGRRGERAPRQGLRVSIDSFDPVEAEAGGRGRGRAGAEREREQPGSRPSTGASRSWRSRTSPARSRGSTRRSSS